MHPPSSPTLQSPWTRFANTCVSAYHRYGNWLVSISWWRFFGLSMVLIIAMGILHDLPPLSWTYTVVIPPKDPTKPQASPKAQSESSSSESKRNKASSSGNDGVDISIDEHGVRIRARPTPPAAPAQPGLPGLPGQAAKPAQPASGPAKPEVPSVPEVNIKLPPGADSQTVREAVEEAKRDIESAMEDMRQEAKDAAEEAVGAFRPRIRTHTYGESLMPLTMWFILLSGILKITYKGKVQAEAKAAQATEVAESESLKRQVIEARMAAMQAQVEPHFLFNTLASIDHLIETDPPRASIMQKNLIALLRASMPTMREANAQGTRDLGKELAVTVADTGLGFGKADTAGTGIGLSNIRERLALLYGGKASLHVTETAGGGTTVIITVPYVARTEPEPAEPV